MISKWSVTQAETRNGYLLPWDSEMASVNGLSATADADGVVAADAEGVIAADADGVIAADADGVIDHVGVESEELNIPSAVSSAPQWLH
ncbi:hypothetical protein E2P81_ATG09679 [Venturia nashicola]|uniref:Uncharacterized protein n=1 Tax=Venturia nashicola TaxID=86259 RepID=A0A4Z1NNF2_9PEZI|nr:hypothetical protein E6O75_ATG09889 [Venturia nashicola]TLD26022.1 hypothetical protein E2P81_ATG09679 [Venturia nashicola]